MYKDEELQILSIAELKREVKILEGQKREHKKKITEIDDSIVGLKEELRRKKIVEEQSKP